LAEVGAHGSDEAASVVVFDGEGAAACRLPQPERITVATMAQA
jgi:hypothetical protein